MPTKRAPRLPTIRTWDEVLLPSGLILLFGHRGKGKTGTAYALAERGRAAKRRIAAFGLSAEAKRRLPGWVAKVDDIHQVAALAPHIIIADEAAFSVNARRAMSTNNVDWNKLVAITRHKQHLLVFIAQHTRQLDVGLVADADLVIFKEPSLLHIKFSRPELRDELQAARDRFAKAKGDRRSWNYVVDFHSGATGWLQNDLPKFWSERLSRAFAAVELGEGAAA